MPTDITNWLRQSLHAAAARGLVVELNGTMAAAVVVRLCQLAAPGKVIGLIMSSQDDEARIVAETFQLPVMRSSLGAAHNALASEVRTLLESLPDDIRTS